MHVLATTQPGNYRVVTEGGPNIPVFPVEVTPGDGAGTVFVWRPLGVTAGNVFASWSDLMAAVAVVQGPKWIQVDGGPTHTHIPAGTWSIDGCTILSLQPSLDVIVSCLDGAHLTYLVAYLQNIKVQGVGTTPVVTIDDLQERTLFLLAGALITGSGGVPFLEVKGTGSATVSCSDANLGNGADPCITTDSGGLTSILALDFTEIQPQALAGADPATLYATSDVLLDSPQAKAPTINWVSLATQVAYTPATAGNWHPPPALVAAALNQLAAPSTTTAQNGVDLTGTTITFSMAGVAQTKSGAVTVTGILSGTDTAAEGITVHLERDSTPIGPPVVVSTAGDLNSWWLSLSWPDQLPDTSPHTYKIIATSEGGTLTVPSTQAGLFATEQ